MTTSGAADDAPVFPPLLSGERVPAALDPMAKALAACASGIDAGTVFWSEKEDVLEAAIALAPETPLDQAMAAVMVAQNGLSDALGALAPPEVAVTWEWPQRLRVNGALCGAMTADSDARDADAHPHWLLIGLTLQLAPTFDAAAEPGEAPDVTALWEEGCISITRTALLESWARHMLVWLNRLEEDGFRPIHDAWIGRAERVGESVSFTLGEQRREGLFLGLDENGAMLLKTGNDTRAVPLREMLGAPASLAT